MSEAVKITEKQNDQKKSKFLIRITLTALFAALTAAGTFVAIPIGPVPIVLQNMFAVLSGLILGPVLGGASVALYLLAGILNFPVFAGGTGGIARLLGPTGGYLLGYLLSALVGGLILGRPRQGEKPGLPRRILAVTVGLLVVYLPGLIWLKTSLGLPWFGPGGAFVVGLIPFLPGDALKGAAAVILCPRLRRSAGDFLDRE